MGKVMATILTPMTTTMTMTTVRSSVNIVLTNAAHAHQHDHDHDHAGGSCCAAPAPIAFGSLAASAVVADGIRTSMRIMQMDCPTEEALIRKKLGGMASVKSLEFNLMQRVLTVVHAPNALEPVLEAVRSLGFQPELPDASGQLAATTESKKPGGRWRWPVLPRSPRKR
jgi:Cd2+/Zn2+-exporting ATPase